MFLVAAGVRGMIGLTVEVVVLEFFLKEVRDGGYDDETGG